MKSRSPCYLHIDDQELIVSKRCSRGSRGSMKLDEGKTYSMVVYYDKEDDINYLGWSKVYGKKWIDDFKDKTALVFI